MMRTVVFACLSVLAFGKLKNSAANHKGFCYGYKSAGGWCWLTHDGLTDYVKQGDGGYQCKDYNGYRSHRYCKNAKAAGPAKVHHAAHHASKSSKHSGSSGKSPWSKYLASLTGKSDLDWEAACKSLGQTPSGYGMGSGGGKSTYHLTCDSNKIDVVCHGNPFTKCESAYKPPAVSSDTPPPGNYNVGATATGSGLTQEEVQTFLNIHNKMRCAVGAPPVQWDGALQRQAQATQDRIGKFKHSRSYDMDIPAGENLATGTNVLNAAWMWFTEYLQSTSYANGGETGHYSAMSWKGVTHIGCGVGHTGDGVIRCQYRGSPLPNMAGSYGSNLDKFYGNPADFEKCGMTAAEVKAKAQLFAKWGILHPKGTMASNLGLYSVTDGLWASASPGAFYGACAFMGAAAMLTMGVAIRRRRSPTPTQADAELLVEAAEGLE